MVFAEQFKELPEQMEQQCRENPAAPISEEEPLQLEKQTQFYHDDRFAFPRNFI